ncbi:MAG TPA: shikimate dehydrogenase [Candidatus Hydrogenedentes bacterium]|nr:shikimate dehydrogenase [Candidatus Hydrogenedentota bacterium]HOS02876.1 shikimate dehydrogenase [Candidatus Hydrogenedentota bacterium]
MQIIDTATQLCAVIGNPIEHSLSPTMHNAAYAAAGLNCVYLAFKVEDLRGCLAGMRAFPSFRGMSVTIPHKVAIMDFLDEVEPMAQHVGSVNTVTHEKGRLIGSTTDGAGALRAFSDAGVSMDGKKVLFVGSGGAVRAVSFAVAEMTSAKAITILGMEREQVAGLVADLKAKAGANASGGDSATDLAEAMRDHDIVMHGTPLGMYPHNDATCLPKESFRRNQVVFDMVYRPFKTRLLCEAEQAGCVTIPGIHMLVNQAVLQFERWTGLPAPVEAMRSAVMPLLETE